MSKEQHPVATAIHRPAASSRARGHEVVDNAKRLKAKARDAKKKVKQAKKAAKEATKPRSRGAQGRRKVRAGA